MATPVRKFGERQRTLRPVMPRRSLAHFAKCGLLEEDARREPLAGFLASLASAVPGGDGGGLRLYSDVLAPAGECAFGEVRDAALREEIRDHRGLPCAPSSTPEVYIAPDALAAIESLGVVSSV